MEKINVIQFLPYFPPHKWWLETHAEEWSFWWEKKWYWRVINVTFWDNKYLSQIENFKPWNLLIIPAFDLIWNFPFPKFWKKEFWRVLNILKIYISDDSINQNYWKWSNNCNNNVLVITRTRFFLSSLMWWIFAKLNKIKWCHIEHWSDFVKLNTNIKSLIAYIYDKTFWNWIIKYSNIIVSVSHWSKEFILKNFSKRTIDVIYRWIKFRPNSMPDKKDQKIIYLWFVWRLRKLKWIDLLLHSISKLTKQWINNINLIIIWNWEEKNDLEKLAKQLWIDKIVKFKWEKNRDEILNKYLPEIDILINPSYQEGMPTSVIEWLFNSCIAVASDVWWTKEISDKNDLILFESWNIQDLSIKLTYAIKNFDKLKWLSKNTLNERFNWDKNIEKYFNLFKSNLQASL